MRISSESNEVLKRFEMLFLNDNRDCIFQKELEEFTIKEQKFGPFRKGDQITLPNWIIERLLKDDYVRIVPNHAYDSLRQLENIYREEEKYPHRLQEFNPYLYVAIARKILRLQSDKTSMDPRKYEEVEKLQKIVPFLVETRLSKILRVAKSGAYQEKRNQMTLEERWLCEELLQVLAGWRQNIIE